MVTKTGFVIGLAAVLGIVGAGQQKPPPEAAAKAIQQFKSELPNIEERFAARKNAPPSNSAGALPTPTLVEPFEIGEALYDPSRMADAVVSLLGLMAIAIVPDAAANAPSTATRTGLTLSESEVHALINLGREDFEGADDIDNLPYGFSELHAGIADLLPGISVEQLAETYSRAFQARPEDLIPKAMMGRPIEPDMKISRAQIWFLLMDGFAGAAATNGRWGTADKLVPDLKSPNAQWTPEELREVLARLPLLTANQLVTMSAPQVISQGPTAGPPVNLTARVKASASPLVSRATGRTLIAPRAGGSLATQDVSWHLHKESLLHEMGKAVTPVDEAAPVGADGIARFAFQPGPDRTKGVGQLINEWETVEARFDTRGLVANAYAAPASLAGLTIGGSRTRANVRVSWRSPDVLALAIANVYDQINFDIPGLGGGTRDGIDIALLNLIKRQDGSYVGRGVVTVKATQTLRAGPLLMGAGSYNCAKASVITEQEVGVIAETQQAGFGPTHVLDDFIWLDRGANQLDTMSTTRPDGGYYRLLIFPITEAPFGRPCLSYIPAGTDRQGWGARTFIPLNDAQWTTSSQGYGFALKAQGLTKYLDVSSYDPLGLPLPEVKAAFKLTGTSLWLVVAGPTMDAVMGRSPPSPTR